MGVFAQGATLYQGSPTEIKKEKFLKLKGEDAANL